MFLKQIFYAMPFVLIASPALAAKSAPLETGTYAVEKGPAEFCLPFKLAELPKKDDVPVYVSPLHSFYLKDQKNESVSDLDPNCKFVETVKRKDKKNETVISVTNKEICKGKTVSSQTSRFTLKAGSIVLDVVEQDATGYSCSWARAKK